MDYLEMLFALEVRKMARKKMAIDASTKCEREGTKTSKEYEERYMKLFDELELDYRSYVKSVISDIEKTAKIIRSND